MSVTTPRETVTHSGGSSISAWDSRNGFSSYSPCVLDSPATEKMSSNQTLFVFPAYMEKRERKEVETQQVNFSSRPSSVCLLVEQVRCMLEAVRREQLPWIGDFFDTRQFVCPISIWEALERINLNLPFYAANYAVISHTITLAFLLWYDILFCVFVCAVVVLLMLLCGIHFQNDEKQSGPRNGACSGGFRLLYNGLSIIFSILCFSLLFLFGLRILCFLLLINFALIIPHAVWRRPTYFDDEELEKLRPKLVEHLITLTLWVVAYMERKGANSRANTM